MQVLDLIAAARSHERYSEILSHHRTFPNYEHLHYHNEKHVAAVLNLFEVLVRLSGRDFPQSHISSAELAIAFHDIGHTGHPDLHDDGRSGNNIVRALLIFYQSPYSYSGKKTNLVATLIELTKYPHEPIDSEAMALFTACEFNLELLYMVRDADILWGMLPGCAEQSMIGLWKERKAAGLEEGEMDPRALLKRQLEFIRSYVPYSKPGQVFKSDILEIAEACWRAVAAKYVG